MKTKARRMLLLIGMLGINCLLSACFKPSRDFVLGRIKEPTSRGTSGIFQNKIEIPIVINSEESTIYVQEGVQHESIATLNPMQPFCSLTTVEVFFTYPDQVEKLNITNVPLRMDRTRDPTDMILYPDGKKLLLAFSQHENRIRLPNEHRPKASMVRVDTILNCARKITTPQVWETRTMTAGDLMDIFNFTYVWYPPNV